jgi:magnesium-transporting ATPase (P-type)
MRIKNIKEVEPMLRTLKVLCRARPEDKLLLVLALK